MHKKQNINLKSGRYNKLILILSLLKKKKKKILYFGKYNVSQNIPTMFESAAPRTKFVQVKPKWANYYFNKKIILSMMYVIMLRTRYDHELRYTEYGTGGDKTE